jgi:FtsZ-binding cell division protein ZapB
MGLYDDPIEPHSVEALRRSIAMLAPGQSASMDRTRALALLAELQRLQHEHRYVVNQLRVLLGRLEA